jgi:hypothetical protein
VELTPLYIILSIFRFFFGLIIARFVVVRVPRTEGEEAAVICANILTGSFLPQVKSQFAAHTSEGIQG